MQAVDAWEARGARHTVGGHELFVVDLPPASERARPLLLLHGFPTCSFDYRHVVDRLAAGRRVVTLDFLGYGLSAKPDRDYPLTLQADLAEAVVRDLGIDEVDLATHDMGDTIGGELLARDLDGELGFSVGRRVLTNGSIYIEMADLRGGQELLLSLPDEKLTEDLPAELFYEGLPPIFGPRTQPSTEELDAQYQLLAREEGTRLMPRLIRYIEQRRAHQHRWTGAIERHPAPLRIVWGDVDPVAVVAMAHRLADARPDAELAVLEGVGHFPMIEVPERFADAVLAGLDGG